jgi:hypothetical protein
VKNRTKISEVAIKIHLKPPPSDLNHTTSYPVNKSHVLRLSNAEYESLPQTFISAKIQLFNFSLMCAFQRKLGKHSSQKSQQIFCATNYHQNLRRLIADVLQEFRWEIHFYIWEWIIFPKSPRNIQTMTFLHSNNYLKCIVWSVGDVFLHDFLCSRVTFRVDFKNCIRTMWIPFFGIQIVNWNPDSKNCQKWNPKNAWNKKLMQFLKSTWKSTSEYQKWTIIEVLRS